MITAWLPGITRHKNIVSAAGSFIVKIFADLCSCPGVPVSQGEYRSLSDLAKMTARLLSPAQLAASSVLNIIPPPQVLLRIFVSTLRA